MDVEKNHGWAKKTQKRKVLEEPVFLQITGILPILSMSGCKW